MNFDMGNDALKMMSFDPRIPQIYVYNEKGVRFAHTQTADIEGKLRWVSIPANREFMKYR